MTPQQAKQFFINSGVNLAEEKNPINGNYLAATSEYSESDRQIVLDALEAFEAARQFIIDNA
jgi:hypothetical protein